MRKRDMQKLAGIQKDDPRKTTVVIVEWVDATGRQEWRRGDEDLRPNRMVSVGFLVDVDEDRILIARLVSEFADVNGSEAIPAPWVTSIRVLKRAPNGEKLKVKRLKT